MFNAKTLLAQVLYFLVRAMIRQQSGALQMKAETEAYSIPQGKNTTRRGRQDDLIDEAMQQRRNITKRMSISGKFK